ncbi:MAG: response regulator [Nitrospiraceae bacterium]
MPAKQPLILLVEDDSEMRRLLRDELSDLGCKILEAEDGDEALKRIKDSPPDLILTDLRMPAGELDYLDRVRAVAPACPVILMTAFGDARTKEEAFKSGVAAYFDKPVRMSDLRAAVAALLKENGILPHAQSQQ